MVQRIQHRRGTAAAATAANPVLAAGEFGYETDTGKVKIGDGITAWVGLGYMADPAAVPAGAVMRAGNWYSVGDFPRGSQSFGDGLMTAIPMTVTRAGTIGALSANVTGAGSVGSVIRMGVYNETNGFPSTLLLDAGTVSSASTGVKTITGLTATVTPGRYWIAVVPQGAPATSPTLASLSGDTGLCEFDNESSALTGGLGWYGTGVTGALGAFPALNLSGTPYAMAMKAV